MYKKLKTIICNLNGSVNIIYEKYLLLKIIKSSTIKLCMHDGCLGHEPMSNYRWMIKTKHLNLVIQLVIKLE
jgi:hypothetical protein